MGDHVWKEKGNHLPLSDKVKIIDRNEHWRISRRLKESAHMLIYSTGHMPKYRDGYNMGTNNQKG